MHRFKILFFILTFPCLIQAQNSVLSKGQWIKIAIQNEGVYDLTQSFFNRNGVATKNLNPQDIKVYSGHMGLLPQKNSDLRIKDLIEIPVKCIDTDQKFDANDHILFYSEGPHNIIWDKTKISHKINPYSDKQYLFVLLNGGSSLKILNEKKPVSEPIYDQMLGYVYNEIELKNVLSSGQMWLGDFFYNSLDQKTFLPNVNTQLPIFFETQVMGIGRSDQTLTVSNGSTQISKSILPKSEYNSTDSYARYNRFSNVTKLEIPIKVESENLTINYKLSTENSLSAGGYIDYQVFNYSKKLLVNDNRQEKYFYQKTDLKSYKLDKYISSQSVWELSNIYKPKELEVNNAGVFSTSSENELSSIVVFNREKCPNPEFVEALKNQNIKGLPVPEMLVIYPEKFKSELEPLLIHKKKTMGLEVLSFSTTEVYNEFSSGKIDISAIRDMIRYFWNQNKEKLKYVLLVGDASFDFKNNNKLSFINNDLLVPTYESRESLEPIYSYSSDDFYGFLDDTEGEWPEGRSVSNFWISNQSNDHLLDVAVGRLPVKSNLELRNVIKKIIRYETSKDQSWKNKLSFVGDNRDYNIHQRDAERLSDLANANFKGFEISKLMLDEFEIVGTGLSSTAPTATKSLNKIIADGQFIINYNGHGSEDGWTQEKLLTIGEILNWQNIDRLPIFFTATCQFGKFDNPSVVSGAELSLLNPNGGAIALLTTTRPVYSSTNEKINSAFYNNISKAKTLGELFVLTKNQSLEGEINRNFNLLGDPSMRLPSFQNKVILNKVNTLKAENIRLNALDKVTISGSSTIKNGILKYRVFDKSVEKKTLGTFQDGPVFTYNKINNLLFEGNSKLVNGSFETTFVLPKNIAEGSKNAKIALFVINADSTETALGFFDDLYFNSKINGLTEDNIGPEISLQSIENQRMVVNLSDVSGILNSNVDEKYLMQIIVNDTFKLVGNQYFISEFDFTKGQIVFPMQSLQSGKNKIKLIVFDSYNNKSEKTFDLSITKPIFTITRLYNFPNPFTDFTSLIIKHNRPAENIEVELKVYDIIGNLIKETEFTCLNCKDEIDFGLDFELKNALSVQLFYKVNLKTLSDNSQTSSSGKLLFWK